MWSGPCDSAERSRVKLSAEEGCACLFVCPFVLLYFAFEDVFMEKVGSDMGLQGLEWCGWPWSLNCLLPGMLCPMRQLQASQAAAHHTPALGG